MYQFFASERPHDHEFVDSSRQRDEFRVLLQNFLVEMYWINQSRYPPHQQEAKAGLENLAKLVSLEDYDKAHLEGDKYVKGL